MRSSWFVPVVSAASVNPSSGRYMVMEIEYAAELGLIRQNRVIPLLLTAAKPKKWLKPFDMLMPLGVIKINLDERRDYLRKIARLCRQMNVIYRPVLRNRPGLPFWKGFLDEVTAIRKRYPEAWDLMPVLTEFDCSCDCKDWRHARELITHYNYSIAYLDDNTAGVPNSRLVQAYCDCATGNPESAEPLLKQAAEELPDAASVHGSIARLHLLRKEPYQAREHLVAALARCGDASLRERMYYLHPMMELGEPIPEDDRSRVLTADVTDWETDERIALYSVRCALLYQSARYKPAIDLHEAVHAEGLHSTATVLYAHLSLVKLERTGDAEQTLIGAIEECGTNGSLDAAALNFQLAEFYLATDQIGKTLTIYEKVLTAPGTVTRKFAVRYARILGKLGDENRTRTECLQILGGRFPLPSSYEDFYYDGFASYLLGNTERAKYDFERSRQFDVWYPRVREPACRVSI